MIFVILSLVILVTLIASLIVRVPKRRNFVKEVIEDLPMIDNKEDDNVIENGDAVIRLELTNELTPSDSSDSPDTNSQCANNAGDNHKSTASLGPVFQWPGQAPLLHSLQFRHQGQLSTNTLERLRELGIYREREQQEQESLESLQDIARKTGLSMRRRSIRISFDTFMSKSRPGLEVGEDEKENVEEVMASKIAERRKEKQFGNVRRRNNSLSDKQKLEKKKTALRTKSLTLNS